MTTTQSCAECGTRAEPGQSFCDACGAVLSWTDRAGARTGASEGAGEGAAAHGSLPAPAHDGRPDPAASPAAGDPGWDPFARSGAAGLPRTPRDLLHTDEPGGANGEPVHGSSAPAGPPAEPADPAARLDQLSMRLDALAAGRLPETEDATTGADPHGSRAADTYDVVAAGGAGARHEPASADANGSPTAPSASRPSTGPATAPTSGPAFAPSTDANADARSGPYAADARTSVPSPSGPAPSAPPPMSDTAPTEPVPTPPSESAADRARRLLVPVTDPDPRPAAAPSVAPVLPGRPVAARPQSVRAPGVEPGAAGGVPCPWCATANRPDRHFCARCAMPMARDEQALGRLPWWRRLLGFRNGETPWAGDRPRLRRTFDRVLTWLGAAIVLTVLIVLAVNIPRGVQATRDHFAGRAPVAPDHVSASRSYPGHKPDLAFDKFNNTWWGPGVTPGTGEWLEARFDEPIRLLDVLITPGVSTRPDQLTQSALPHRVEARITTADGRTTTRELTLDQGAGAQRRAFRFDDVTAVRFTIESAYGVSASRQVAIAEVEFFGPSNASGS